MKLLIIFIGMFLIVGVSAVTLSVSDFDIKDAVKKITSKGNIYISTGTITDEKTNQTEEIKYYTFDNSEVKEGRTMQQMQDV